MIQDETKDVCVNCGHGRWEHQCPSSTSVRDICMHLDEGAPAYCPCSGFTPKKKALITGITGQDGSYLAELLISKGYEVHGLVRRVAGERNDHRLSRLRHCLSNVRLHPSTIESYASVFAVVQAVQPDELYHLAAQSFVGESFEDPFTTMNTNVNGTLHVLESVRLAAPKCRVYFAGTSEMFGNQPNDTLDERSPMAPRSPYGVSKVAGYNLVRNYRERGLYACTGILFNHESPRRGHEFVTRTISLGAARAKLWVNDGRRSNVVPTLNLGCPDAARDWGFAGDYVEAMWLMLQRDTHKMRHYPDLVIATCVPHTVDDFARLAFKHVGLNHEDFVRYNSSDKLRPTEIQSLKGDASWAKTLIGWKPKVSFEQLVQMMVDADMQQLAQGQ